MKNRLSEFIELYELTPTELAGRIEMQPSAISHLLSGRNKPSFDLLHRLFVQFPDLNPKWFILGEGEMRLPVQAEAASSNADDDNSSPLVGAELIVENDAKQSRSYTDTEPQSENNLPELPNENAHNMLSRAERVIILYSDGTFSDYLSK